MSTKNLASTVIEGGRSHPSRYARRHSNANVRGWERVTSHELLTASELDELSYRPREKVYRDFGDELVECLRFRSERLHGTTQGSRRSPTKES